MATQQRPIAQWVTASPLWPGAQQPAAMQQPALLTFHADSFMEDLAALLQSAHPEQLAGAIAQPRSYRARPAGTPANWTPPPPAQLKLYQPVHGDFNLVAASLVCRIPGLPDRFVDTAHGEQVGFVLRRLDGDDELAWVNDPASGKGWQPSAGCALACHEEVLPLFPVNFSQGAQPRRLLAGLIPTSSRETFMAAPKLSPIDTTVGVDDPDPRLHEVITRVIEPLKSLGQAVTIPNTASLIEGSLALLLDFAEWIQTYRAPLWPAIDHANVNEAPTADDKALYNFLANWTFDGTNWRAALKAAWDERDKINGEAGTEPTLTYNLKDADLSAGKLAALLADLKAALGPYTKPDQGPSPLPLPKLEAGPQVSYVVRCVFRRTNCPLLCPDTISAASAPFAIAPFLDFDAPARPVRITMPIDTSIAGLRKFNKNVAFQLSDKLRSQLNSVGSLKDLMDGKLASGTPVDIGVICSFSIPIITIVALLLLLIFVFLLNIVFWWLPFFRICLPMKKP